MKLLFVLAVLVFAIANVTLAQAPGGEGKNKKFYTTHMDLIPSILKGGAGAGGGFSFGFGGNAGVGGGSKI